MYSDHEIECLYLGRPFEDKKIHGEDNEPPGYRVTARDIERVRAALPVINLLVNTACMAVK